jgi:hypothetical protein
MAQADAAKLDELLREVQSGEAGVQAMLADVMERAAGYAPYGDMSTDRQGQGVTSPWDMVRQNDNVRVVIGDLESRLSHDVADRLLAWMGAAYDERGTPIYESLEAVIVGGLDQVENCDR